MAKQSGGYLGGFSGKLGPAVGYMWNGKWCLRSHNPMVHNPRTPAQEEHREVFKQEVQLAARMRWAVTKTMTGLARESGMTSYNLFVKVNQPAFSVEEGRLQVDYSALRLSMGDVLPVEFRDMSWSEDNVLTVNFRSGNPSSCDYVYVYVYVPDCEYGYLSAPVYRSTRRVSFAVPDFVVGHEMHVYLMAMSEDGCWSDSLYAGPVERGAESLTTDPSPEKRGMEKEEDLALPAGEAGKNGDVSAAGNQGDRKDRQRW